MHPNGKLTVQMWKIEDPAHWCGERYKMFRFLSLLIVKAIILMVHELCTGLCK